MTESADIIEFSAPENPEPATSQEDRIRSRAYELYEQRNGNAGDAESDWYRAEAELNGDAAEPAE